MKTRSLSCAAPVSPAENRPAAGVKPMSRSSRSTVSRPRLTCPATFSRKIHSRPGPSSRAHRATSGHRCRSSSSPSRLPAALNGWQGYPASRVSIRPAQGRASNVRRSVQIGAGAKYPARWPAMMQSRGYSSHSTKHRVWNPGSASMSPRSSPPAPAQRERPCRGRKGCMPTPFIGPGRRYSPAPGGT